MVFKANFKFFGFYIFLAQVERAISQREYGFDEFAPGLLGFGTDGCGELYAIDVRENGTGAVGDIPATSLQWEDFRELSASFDAFADKLMAGTPIIEPDDVDASSQ